MCFHGAVLASRALFLHGAELGGGVAKAAEGDGEAKKRIAPAGHGLIRALI